MHHEAGQGKGNIRHYNLRRTITVEANIDKNRMDTVAANNRVKEEWARIGSVLARERAIARFSGRVSNRAS